MKILFLVFLSSLFFYPQSVAALNLGGTVAKEAATAAGYSAQTSETTFSETLGTVVKAALSLVGVIFLILMVYAGFLWMTAHGKEDQIEQAQNIIRTAIIGLIITVGAYSITAFVLPRVLSKATGRPLTSDGPCIGACRRQTLCASMSGTPGTGTCTNSSDICCSL